MRYPPFKMHFGVFQRGVILVNEVGMVFFYAIFRNLKKSLSKGGRQYGVFILRKVRLEG
ncbi:hypothetical protein D1872_117520 [compost metagenome]